MWYGNVLLAPIYTKKPSFYQDRLGTNMGKVERKHVSAGHAGGDAAADSTHTRKAVVRRAMHGEGQQSEYR
jgi:hypothetical protein